MISGDIPSFCSKVCTYIGLHDLGDDSDVSDSTFAEPTAYLIRIIRRASKECLLGSNDLQRAEISQWIYFSLKGLDDLCLLSLNNYLTVKSFLVGHHLSVADYCVFVAISEAVRSSLCDLSAFKGVERWIRHIQCVCRERVVPLPSTSHHTLLPIPSFEETINRAINSSSDSPNHVTPSANSITKSSVIDKPAVDSSKENAGAQVMDGSDDSQQDPTRLDIRCGLVLKCWNHPDSDKLLCEEVDLGKESGGVRTIASGIRSHYSAEELVGRKVLVLANLKERSMAGFKSQASIMPIVCISIMLNSIRIIFQGMVLCAVAFDHSAVRLLEVPANTNVGERVLFKGYPVDSVPATPAQMAKKKILEGLAPKVSWLSFASLNYTSVTSNFVALFLKASN
jgi:methionine--tRNA ligase beta chain